MAVINTTPPAERNANAYWIEGCLGPRAGHDDLEKRHIS